MREQSAFSTPFPSSYQQQYANDTFDVEFNGETYVAVVPTPLADDFANDFHSEDDAWRWVFNIQQSHICGSWWALGNKIACAKVLWADLGNIPINDEEEIDEPFLDFEKGTDMHDIWHWFEETFDVSIGRGDLCQ